MDIRKTISEMLGRINTKFSTNQWGNYMNSLYQVETIDYTRTDYDLTKALYYASTVTGRDGKKKGEKYIFGASFAKPIVNSVNSFAFSQSPIFEFTGGSEAQNTEITDFITRWFELHKAEVFQNCKWTSRDGDSYLLLKDDEEYTPIVTSGNDIDIVVNPFTGNVVGYDRKVTIFNKGDSSKNLNYVIEYRYEAPYLQVFKYRAGSTTEKDLDKELTRQLEGTVIEDGDNIKLPIIGFHNEKEGNALYGVSEYQNVYYLFANYHAVLENGIKNNIFNSTAIPFITGVSNPAKFLQMNGVKNAEGEYEFRWDPKKVSIGADPNFAIGFANSLDTSSGVQTMLEILFWLICQSSETPEFLMGTAVQSSKASVSEQLPIVLKKAENRRTQYYKFFNTLIDTLIFKYKLDGHSVPDVLEYSFSFPEMVDKDLKLNLEIVKVLGEQAVISDETKLALMDIQVDSYADEVKKARAELAEKQKASVAPATY